MASSRSQLTAQEIVGAIDQTVKREFDSNKRVLSFDEYLLVMAEDRGEGQLRGSAKYMADMMEHFGRSELSANDPRTQSGGTWRFKLFDRAVDGTATKIVGQEAVQNHIFKALQAFARQGINNRLVLLHGPNGSAKSSIIHSIMAGMEDYSHAPEGAVYTFNWIFPVEKYTKGALGLGTYDSKKPAVQTFAKLPDEEIAARMCCDLRDHPLLIIPTEQRKQFLEMLMGAEKVAAVWERLPGYLKKGDLCHRCRLIFDALLAANGGDFKKVLMHVQVERFYFARRYRKGLVTIEPQMHVDAQYQQLTYNKSVSALPVSLQSINLFTVMGDLVDGNRGLIEYSDLLKRPVDSFKYLLTACESGSINIGPSIVYLDVVLLGSTNEVQLDAFKEFPDFTSFKARIDLVRAPYLLSVSQEEEIYSSQIGQFSGDKHIAPHVAWTAALWAVLSRLKKPNSINYAPNVSTLVSNLTPIEKCRLYDTGEVPSSLAPEDRKLLRSAVRKLRDEYTNIPYYEGRMGASSREIKAILFDSAQNPDFPCLSPLAVLREIEEFVKRVTEYEFLKQDVKDGYHDAHDFINIVRTEYLNRIDFEVRESMGLYDSAQWEDFLKRYVNQVSLLLRKEKTKNPITGKLQDPDVALIEELEKIVEAPSDPAERDIFRQNVLSQIGVWSLDHPKEPVVYSKIFPDFWKKMEKHYFESKKNLLTKMSEALLHYDTESASAGATADTSNSTEEARLTHQTLAHMKTRFGYCDKCAKEVVSFLMRQRY